MQPSPVPIEMNAGSSFILVTQTPNAADSQSTQAPDSPSQTIETSEVATIEPTESEHILVNLCYLLHRVNTYW